MNSVTLPNGQVTSRLGFGGTVLKGGPGRQANLRLLSHAYHVGVRHYDVAPSYGLGVAEGILADFIQDKRDSVTVTTKVGLPRPKNPAALARMRALVRPLIAFAPPLRRHLGKSVQRMSGSAATRFDLPHVRASVAESMRELKTDYVDVLLLHEISPAEVTDDLRRYLEDLVASGTVLTYGVGSYRHEAEAVVRACPDLATIMQTSWSVGDRPLELPHEPFTITHGAVRSLEAVWSWLAEDDSRASRLSDEAGADLRNKAELGDLMMGAALANNDRGVVLVSSTRPGRITRHANISTDGALLEKAWRFNLAITRERNSRNP